MKKYNSLLNVIAKYCEIISQTMLFIMVVIILSLPFTRYFFSYSFPWAEELSRYLMIWCVSLLVGNTFAKRDHIKMMFFVLLFPKKYYIIQRTFFEIIFIIYFSWLIKDSYLLAVSMSNAFSPALSLSMFWPYFAIPVSGLLSILFIIKNLIEDVNTLIKK